MIIKIEHDTDAESPRTWCNMGTLLVCEPYTWGDWATGDVERIHFIIAKHPDRVALPVYIYDHSGVTISTTPFACQWDSALCGVIYAERSHMDYVSDEQTLAVLKSEIETLDQWLNGDVWGYTITDDQGTTLDSCWSMYGRDYCQSEANAAVETLRQEREAALDAAYKGLFCATKPAESPADFILGFFRNECPADHFKTSGLLEIMRLACPSGIELGDMQHIIDFNELPYEVKAC